VTPALALEQITCTFAAREDRTRRYTALRDTTLLIAPGEFVSVVGPTGCGKSTLLNVGAGLLEPTAGRVTVNGEALAGINRHAGYLFQADALMPWRNALDNVIAGLEFRGMPRLQALDLGQLWLKRVGLSGFGDRYPHQLSGGMRKRVAMAAALINEPAILLMDEPFGALDVQTKAIMQTELIGLWEELRPTVLFITHDLDEAVALADRVIVMTAGPGAVKASYYIDLPRPRGAVQELRYDQRFLEIQHHIWQSLKDEVERAYARDAAVPA
jgi:sulfonate transport system ATP-binding protein